MADEIITRQELVDAKVDAKDLGECVHGNETGVVTPRLGEPYPTLPKAIEKVENIGGLISAPTLTALQAITPTYNYQLGRDDSTGNEYRWNPAATPPQWVATGRNNKTDSENYTDSRERLGMSQNIFTLDEIKGIDFSRITNQTGRTAVSRITPKSIKVTGAANTTTEVRWRFSASHFKDTNIVSASIHLKSVGASTGAATQAVRLMLWQTSATGSSIRTDSKTIAGPEAITTEGNFVVENIPLDPTAVFVEVGFSIQSVAARDLIFEDFCISSAAKAAFIRPLASPVNLFPDPLYSGQYSSIFNGLARIENNELIMTFEETTTLRQSLYQIPALGRFAPGAIVRFGSEISSNATGATHMTIVFYDAAGTEITRSTQASRIANTYDILSSEFVVPSNCARVDVRLMKDANATLAKFKPAFLYSSYQYRVPFNPQFPLTILYVDGVNGSDSNNATQTAPIKTLTRAMVMAGYYTRIIVAEGDYAEAPQVTAKIGVLEIEAARNARVRLIGGTKITGFTQSSGFSKVWQMNLVDSPLLTTDRSGYWLIQHGVPDATTLIPDSERHSLHEGRTYRISDYTRIWKVNSVAEIEAANRPSWYWFEGVLYLSCVGFGNPNSADIRIPEKVLSPFYTSAITKDQKIKLTGIETFYWLHGFRTWDFSSVEMIRCKAWGNRVNGFEHSNTMTVTRDRCESGGNWVDGSGGHVHTAQGRPNPSGQSCSYKGFNNYEHDTGDDGQSLHEYWRGVDYGGLIEYVGDRAIATAVGAHTVHYEVFARETYKGIGMWDVDDGAAFACVGTAVDGGATTNMELHSCIAENCRVSVNVAGADPNKNVINAYDFKSINPTFSHYNSSRGVMNLYDATYEGLEDGIKTTDNGGVINIKNTVKVT